MINHDFGSYMRCCRKQFGLSQSELAKLSGVSLGHITRIESQHRDVTLTTAHKLAKGLGMELWQMLE